MPFEAAGGKFLGRHVASSPFAINDLLSYSYLTESSLLCVLQSVLQRTSGASLRLELPIWLEQLTPRVQQSLRQVLVTKKSTVKELAIDLISRHFTDRDDSQLLSALSQNEGSTARYRSLETLSLNGLIEDPGMPCRVSSTFGSKVGVIYCERGSMYFRESFDTHLS